LSPEGPNGPQPIFRVCLDRKHASDLKRPRAAKEGHFRLKWIRPEWIRPERIRPEWTTKARGNQPQRNAVVKQIYEN
jgi:hypothetical protein